MTAPAPRDLSGLLVLNKPIGITSRDAIDRISRPLRKTKVGHAGTLDPLASGVLVVCVGPATRLIEYVQRMPKAYRTVVRLGARSDTLDADGTIVEAVDPRVPTLDEVQAAIATQVGEIEQIPPQFSALKVAGKRAYDVARAGGVVELAARTVAIHRVEMIEYEWPMLTLHVDCGSGTYIRSIARDVGEALGCGGLVQVLTRTRIGPFAIEGAVDPLALDPSAIPSLLRPPIEALAGLAAVPISAEQIGEILQGRAIESAQRGETGNEVALVGPGGELVAVAEVGADGRLHPRRVLVH